MKNMLILILLLLIPFLAVAQKLFDPLIVFSKETEARLQKIVKSKDVNFKISKYDGEYSIMKKGKSNVYAYGTEKNSFKVTEFTHWAEVDKKTAIKFYKDLGLIQYKDADYSIETVRFKNKEGTIYVMFCIDSKLKTIMITISRIQFVDECDV